MMKITEFIHYSWKSLQFLIVLVIALFLESCNKVSNNVLILSSAYTDQAEVDSLTQILLEEGNQVNVLSINNLTVESLKNIQTVIYHRSDSCDIEQIERDLKEYLLPYVEKGGNLLLTMEGTRLLNEWGIESQPLDVEYQDAKDYGFGRAVGFHGYREHPIYEGLFGGAYVWKAKIDNQARTLGFSNENVPQAKDSKVLGVNWAYIHYHENRKIVWETPIGNGKILAIGAYLYFSEPNVNRSTLLIFIDNVVDYLNGSDRFKSNEKSWAFDSVQTEKVAYPIQKIELKEEKAWVPEYNGLTGVRKSNKRNFWNVAGQQVLITGREQGRIEEIWMHPIMVLRDLSIGLKYKGKEEVIWLDQKESQMTRCPDYFERSYVLENGRFQEIINASPEQPLMSINYRWDDPNIEDVYVTYTSNLRLMWPYSLNSTGTLFYATDQNGAVTTVFDRSRELNLMAAFDREPMHYENGMYDFAHREINKFTQIPAKSKQVSFLYTFKGTPGKLNFYLSGGESGLDLSADLLKEYMGNSQRIYEESKTYYDNFDEDFLAIESSDEQFNLAYQWAMVSVDKFFCHTPSLGKSLMSGYWATSRGWNGGHKVSGRPGYAWYFGRDTEWTGIALTDYGDYEKVKDILITFGKYQDPDGKVYHELTTSGSAHYDASDATPLYLTLAGDYLRKTGDIEFIRSQWDNIKKSLSFCYSTDTDGDGLIENTNVGHGWQEGWQLYGAHTEIYLAAIWAQALDDCAYMATALGDNEIAHQCKLDMRKTKQLINDNFWNDSLQFFNHGLMQDGSYQEYKCVLGGTPVIFGLTDKEKAVATARNFSNKYYSTDWGVRMVGYDSPFFGLGGYTYGNIWPFHTGCAALAEYQAGLRCQGFRHAYGSLRLFNTWDYGNIVEVIIGDKLSFTGICSHQQWSSSMNLRPLYEGMLGMKVDALKDSMSLSPAFPVDWDYAHIKNIRMANKRLKLNYERTNKQYNYIINNENNQPVNLNFTAVLPLATIVEDVCINGRSVPFAQTEDIQNICVFVDPLFIDRKTDIVIKYNGGIGVFTNFTPLYDGMPDDGLRIEAESYCSENNTYVLEVAGAKGKSYDVEIFTLSEVKEIQGATVVAQKENSLVCRVKFSDTGKEPFINRRIEIELK